MYWGPKTELAFREGRLENFIFAGLTPRGMASLRIVGWIETGPDAVNSTKYRGVNGVFVTFAAWI